MNIITPILINPSIQVDNGSLCCWSVHMCFMRYRWVQGSWWCSVLVTPSDVPLEVVVCGIYFATDFTLMGNLLVNPEMLRKIPFGEWPPTPLAHVFFGAGFIKLWCLYPFRNFCHGSSFSGCSYARYSSVFWFTRVITYWWLLSCVYPKMTSKSATLSKALVTELTLEWLLSCVDSVVWLASCILGEPLGAELTLEWFFTCVYPKVTFKIVTLSKVLVAELALEWLLSCVDTVVWFQLVKSLEVLGAELTLEWFFSSVYPKVIAKSATLSKALVTELTLEWLLSCVD